MFGVRLILAIHNHQPVGNFDDVFESAYRDSYLPFLDVIEGYNDIAFALHTSGPLMEWLVENHADYVGRIRRLVDAGRVEILGGGYTEPILTMIPHRDRVGQIASYSRYLGDLFGTKIRGIWLPERVWEQHLVTSLAEADVEYTVLDDFHFQRAGLEESDLQGYYLTEDDGRLLKVFPGSEKLRYLMPFREPHDTYEFLRQLAHDRPGSTVVFADDGEKFGSWPQTFDHVYTNGWLKRFCDMLSANRDWLQATTFARAVDASVPIGKVYLPDSSYREMTEWVLPPRKLIAYEHAEKSTRGNPDADRLRPFARAGGFWRNFKAKYAESDEMYTRMLGLSHRLSTLSPDADPDYRELARVELYRGQCNCPYWHGAFGGLYLPHLRNAIFGHLIAAHNALDQAEGKTGQRVSLEVADFNLDARQEVRLENDRLVAFVRPAMGGHVYELDIRQSQLNILATLDRRPEAYHGTIAAAASSGGSQHHEGPASIHDRVVLKQEGLDRMLVYDRYPRKALVDHFYPVDLHFHDLIACEDVERGDFATGTYLAKVGRGDDQVALVMERPGKADGHAIRIRKTIALAAGSPTLEIDYVLEDLPVGIPVHFAVEINMAGMAGNAADRYYTDTDGIKLGTLGTRLDLALAEGLSLTDEWLDLSSTLRWSVPSSLWCYPIETVSQSEGGFESVYQSSAIVPHWLISADASRRWSVKLIWTMDHAHFAEVAAEPMETGAEMIEVDAG